MAQFDECAQFEGVKYNLLSVRLQAPGRPGHRPETRVGPAGPAPAGELISPFEGPRKEPPGGRFLASFYLLNATSTQRLPALKDPLCFVFPDGKVTTTRPHRQGLLAYREDYVLEVLTQNRLKPEPIDYGSWEPVENGLAQDFVVAAKL